MAPVDFISLLLTLVGLYLGIGVLFALYVAWFAVGKLDPAAKNATWGFRFLIMPGLAVFWPLMLRRLLSGVASPPVERNAHRDRAGGTL